MTSYRVIGIDPSLTNTGMVVLESSGPGRYAIAELQTVKTNSNSEILDRIHAIHREVQQFVGDHACTCHAVVMEDPLDQVWVHKNKSPRSIAVMGAAVGAVMSSLAIYPLIDQYLIKTNEWMPKKAGAKGGSCFLPHQETVRFLHSQIKIPEGATEHEVMAGGCARFWIEQQRFAERRVG